MYKIVRADLGAIGLRKCRSGLATPSARARSVMGADWEVLRNILKAFTRDNHIALFFNDELEIIDSCVYR